MYKCIATGKNLNYGKQNEIIYVNDNYTLVALKQGWIEKNILFLGKYKPYTKYMIETNMKAIERDISLLKIKLNFYKKKLKEIKGDD